MTTNASVLCTHNPARSVLGEGRLQLLQLPLGTMGKAELRRALNQIDQIAQS
jgi:hypothetical protein